MQLPWTETHGGLPALLSALSLLPQLSCWGQDLFPQSPFMQESAALFQRLGKCLLMSATRCFARCCAEG